MADTPPPQSWTILGSAVLAVKLSTRSVSNCCFFFFFVGVGPAEPDHLAPCLRSFLFKVEWLTLSQVFQLPAERVLRSV